MLDSGLNELKQSITQGIYRYRNQNSHEGVTTATIQAMALMPTVWFRRASFLRGQLRYVSACEFVQAGRRPCAVIYSYKEKGQQSFVGVIPNIQIIIWLRCGQGSQLKIEDFTC